MQIVLFSVILNCDLRIGFLLKTGMMYYRVIALAKDKIYYNKNQNSAQAATAEFFGAIAGNKCS